MISSIQPDQPHNFPAGQAALRILVVEDDADTAESMAILLRLFAHDVQVARDGATALGAVAENLPDVVLLDIGLPKLDGWQLAKAIRHHANGRRPFLIAMSGYGAPADQQRSQEAGIDLHLVKPVEPEALREVLARFYTVIGPTTEVLRKEQNVGPTEP